MDTFEWQFPFITSSTSQNDEIFFSFIIPVVSISEAICLYVVPISEVISLYVVSISEVTCLYVVSISEVIFLSAIFVVSLYKIGSSKTCVSFGMGNVDWTDSIFSVSIL